MIAWLAAKFGARFIEIASRVVLWLLVVGAALAPLWLAYRHGVTVTADKYQAVAVKLAAANALSRLTALEAVRA